MSRESARIDSLCELEDLGLAYRKTKVDLFYSTRVCRRELAEYESKLAANLKTLRARILNGKIADIPEDTWTLIPKSLEPVNLDTPRDKGKANNLHDTDPARHWESISEEVPHEAEFRLMEKLPIEFHVFATLWIHKVGEKFDGKLTEAARGNRLRRKSVDELNLAAMGSFVPYSYPYNKWRTDGTQAIKDALRKKKRVIAVTADVSAFYHNLDAGFLLDRGFLRTIGVGLTAAERKLHTLFVHSLARWATQTPIGRGVPVGLAASAIVANVALFELDAIVEKEVVPLYYGRYVDDVFLVIENTSDFRSPEEIWNWIVSRSAGALHRDLDLPGELRFSRPYLEKSEIRFANNKNKLFLLYGASGKAVLASIERQLRVQSSEWRALPEIPSSGAQVESMLVTAIESDGATSRGLSKTDRLTIRRADLALKLRDIEAYNRALPPDSWIDKRHSFLEAFIRHVLVLPVFFDFFNYLSRVVEIATSCADFEHVRRILVALERMLDGVSDCELRISSESSANRSVRSREILSRFRYQVVDRVQQAIEGSIPLDLSVAQKLAWRDVSREWPALQPTKNLTSIQKLHQKLFTRDLATNPLKQLTLPAELSFGSPKSVADALIERIKLADATAILPDHIVAGAKVYSAHSRLPDAKSPCAGLLFPTRPPNIHELYFWHPNPFSVDGARSIGECIYAMRGFHPATPLPTITETEGHERIVVGTECPARRKRRIAVSSWKTNESSWVASVANAADPDSSRFDRLNRLVNSVIQCRKRPDYLVLPELSMPTDWFLWFAIKLKNVNISLICGVEYQHAFTRIVRNQVWAALCDRSLGFPSFLVYCQDKQRPAPREAEELNRIANKRLQPKIRWNVPPVLVHQGFHFGLMVCSELTNATYRSGLRGNVDALFIPEWNQDTDCFAALVESTALDIHAYVIQCNDREHGDSRIRVPHKDAWERDILRVRGGDEDYFVVEEIDIQELRQFQSSHRSPDRPFKPVPDGYVMSNSREALPKP